jgi:hypothetical protein
MQSATNDITAITAIRKEEAVEEAGMTDHVIEVLTDLIRNTVVSYNVNN